MNGDRCATRELVFLPRPRFKLKPSVSSNSGSTNRDDRGIKDMLCVCYDRLLSCDVISKASQACVLENRFANAS